MRAGRLGTTMGSAEGGNALIVGDDVWVRQGLAEGVRAIPGLEVAGLLDHEELAVTELDGSVNVLLVDPRSRHDPWDRFSGVRSIERFWASTDKARVVVISELADHPLLRLRLAEAGAHAAFRRMDLQHVDLLAAAIREGTGVPDLRSSDVAAYGLTLRSRLNDGLRWLQDRPAATWIDGRGGPSRRQMISVRESLTKVIGIRPIDSGSGANVERRHASWRQLLRLLREARGHEPLDGV